MNEAASQQIRVLVVDDSALMRNLVSRIIEAEPDLTVAGKAMNGQFALDKTRRLDPDVLVLDLEMPEMNGIEFLKARKAEGITVPVIILSSIAKKGAEVTMEALSLGASDFVMKPSGSVSEDIHTVGAHLVELVRGVGAEYRKSRNLPVQPPPTEPTVAPEEEAVEQAEASPARPPTPTASPAPAGQRERVALTPPRKITPKRKPGTLDVIAIGISTGGPNALRRVFAEIDGAIGVPIVVVQHMPAGFTTEFAKSLDRICPLEVKEAEDGDLLKPNRVLIAPGNHHIIVERKSLAVVARISESAPVNGHRPSADVLFESVAEAYGNNALAVIMTGMGRDGARRIGDVYEAGGMTLAQNEKSSVVYGMPRVAYEYGYIHKQVDLSEMAATLGKLVKESRANG
ncbi:MAG: chemotaxis response regulator protein-glutamate methylesterase [Spirochaetaceae bacterium]